MRLLFVKPSLAWPRSSGHDIYCYHMMKALYELGAEVSLATELDTDPRAVDGITLAFCGRLSDGQQIDPQPPLRLTWLQERFRSYWGVTREHIRAMRSLAVARRVDVVIAFGLPTLPYLTGVPEQTLRVWAMADEWVYHFLSQVRITEPRSWRHLRVAAVSGLYERAYASVVDRVWVVSNADRNAAKWFAGMPVSDLLPNGVDTDFYRPIEQPETPNSAVFWGRLDFGPNIDALVWFCRYVWPTIIRTVPDARFTIIGYQPTDEVVRLAAATGVSLIPNLSDLRPTVCQHSLVVLPMISGGGIKNKLLEAAAMGRTVVCTPRACNDLRSDGSLPLVRAKGPKEWQEKTIALWQDKTMRARLGEQARRWVAEHYSWATPARDALAAFERAARSRM